MSLRAVAWAVGLASTLLVAPARADDACISHLSFVRLAASDPADLLVQALAPHLRAELDGRDIGVCLGDEGDAANARRAPVAEILLHDDGKTVTISIRDLVTDKRVERALDLASLPPDTRLLAIATSVDELLRASWLETLLASPHGAAPAPVVRAVQASLPEPPPPPPPPQTPTPRRVRAELGAAAHLAVNPGLRTAAGLDVVGALWFGPRLGAYARAGGSRGALEDSLNGAVAADVLRAGAGAMAAFVPSGDRVGLRAEAGLDTLRVGFRGEALERATVRATPALIALQASVGLRSWIDLGRVRVLVGVAGQYALVPAVGTDQTLQGGKIEVAGVKGVGIEAAAAAAWPF